MEKTYYGMFIQDKKWKSGRSELFLEENESFHIRDLLVSCFNTDNYDEPFTVNQYNGNLEPFKKILKRFDSPTKIKKIMIGKTNAWYIHPICVVIMGFYRQMMINRYSSRPYDVGKMTEIACRKIRDLLELHSKVKKVSNIKILYEDFIGTGKRVIKANYYEHKFAIYDKLDLEDMNYLEFLFSYSEQGYYLTEKYPEFVRAVADIFLEYGFDFSKIKLDLMSKIIIGENESHILENLKFFNSNGGDIYSVSEGAVLANLFIGKKEKIILYLLKKGYSLKFTKEDWVRINFNGSYPQDVQTAAIMFKMFDVLKYCVETRKINFFKQYQNHSFFHTQPSLKNHRLLHVAVETKNLSAVDYLLDLNEDLEFTGDCQIAPVNLLNDGNIFHQLLQKPKYTYKEYKSLMESMKGVQYYTDQMDCPICMDPFGAQEIIVFKCGHAVCRDCFMGVIETNNKCPVCRTPIEVDLRVKLELGERKVKSKKKSPRRTKSLPSLRKSRSSKSSPNRSSEYSANNNDKPGSRSSSEERSRKNSVKRALSDGVENLELITNESIQRKKEEQKKKIQNKSTRLLAREKRNEELALLKKKLKKEKIGKSPTQKTRKGKHFTSPANNSKKKSARKSTKKTPSPPRDFRETPRRSGRKR